MSWLFRGGMGGVSAEERVVIQDTGMQKTAKHNPREKTTTMAPGWYLKDAHPFLNDAHCFPQLEVEGLLQNCRPH